MKKVFSIVFALTIVFIACKKSNTNPPDNDLPKSAETKSQYNNTSFGVYKGVTIGSTGTIVLRINNGDTIVKAYLSINNIKDTLSTTQQLTAGQPITNLLLTGRFSSMTFSANADGSNAILNNLSITGHPNAIALLIHENSTQQVMCYEGTFNGGLTGNVCFIKFGSNNNNNTPILKHIARISNDPLVSMGVGIYLLSDTGVYTHGFYETGTTVRTFNGRGRFSGNTFEGLWTAWWPAAGGNQGSFTCNRTY